MRATFSFVYIYDSTGFCALLWRDVFDWWICSRVISDLLTFICVYLNHGATSQDTFHSSLNIKDPSFLFYYKIINIQTLNSQYYYAQGFQFNERTDCLSACCRARFSSTMSDSSAISRPPPVYSLLIVPSSSRFSSRPIKALWAPGLNGSVSLPLLVFVRSFGYDKKKMKVPTILQYINKVHH